MLVPGSLSSNHGQILAGQEADRCAACHGDADGSLGSWVASTLAIGKSKGLSQSELCLKCHDQSLAINTALNPHNVSPEQLAKVTAKHRKTVLDIGRVVRPPVHDHQIACSACHREHHGSKHDLAAMTDTQCQTCHHDSFHSFETDHPEFANYSQKRRSRIAFDHSTHSLQHFPSRQSKFNCSQCHVDDSFQHVKQLASYEQSCAGCHNEQIVESGQEGLTLIALPMLDTDAIEAAHLNVGSWPLAATGDFDGPIPPIMRVLLSADPRAAEILGRKGPEFDFADIDPTEVDHVNDAVELAWAIKRLLYELSLDGPTAIRTRLETVMQLRVSDDELQKMVTNLDESVFQNAVKRWLPNLTVEVAIDRFGPPQTAPIENPQSLPGLALKKTERRWWPSDEKLLLRIGTKDDLLATNPLAGLVKPLSERSKTPTIPVIRVPNKKIVRQQEPVKQSQPAPTPLRLRLKNAHTDPLNDPDLLAINPLQKIETKTNPLARDHALPKIVTPPSPEPGRISKSDQAEESAAATDAKVAIEASLVVEPESMPAVIPSGWFRNDRLFRLSYQPTGHADQCLQSWIELVARVSDADKRPETKPLFQETLSTTSMGMCRNCHTVDQLPNRAFSVNWGSEYRDPAVRSFTRFAHGPHMIQPHLQDCSYCHTLDETRSNHQSLHRIDATNIVSNFLPIKKSSCAECHQANQTQNGCTQCHNYHIGSRVIGSR